MKRSIFFVVLMLIGAACSGADDGGALIPPGDGTSGPQTFDVVGTTQNTFDPSTVTIAVGDTVSWTWTDGVPGHNVVAVDGSFNSGEPVENGSFEQPFDEAGTVEYYCTVHGTAEGAGMFGTIMVSG